ncbi:MAG TPA: AMP-binding protein, partial [Candidatus Acidoferrales bacterium]|nr:AMP-binding protein [Candidatus Acidoferrales bacterium]
LVSVNIPPSRSANDFQVERKEGTVGRPIPGVTAKVTDLDTGVELSSGKPGMLWIKGPNVMQGYLGKPELTAQVIKDGWYVTGDIAMIDEEGFIQITGRESRFSKIGGEMVPHIKVEERLHELAGVTDQRFVVTGVPDGKKGERLVVLHTLPPAELQSVLERIGESGLPNLWTPRPNQFLFVEELPHLGTGKLDLRRIREMALEFSPTEKESSQ